MLYLQKKREKMGKFFNKRSKQSAQNSWTPPEYIPWVFEQLKRSSSEVILHCACFEVVIYWSISLPCPLRDSVKQKRHPTNIRVVATKPEIPQADSEGGKPELWGGGQRLQSGGEAWFGIDGQNFTGGGSRRGMDRPPEINSSVLWIMSSALKVC